MLSARLKLDPRLTRSRGWRGGAQSAFTLLEIMLAVMVLVIITVVVYDFTDATMSSSRFAVTLADREGAYNGMRRLVEAQLGSIPVHESGSFLGLKINNKGPTRRDMLQLVCPAGNGLLSPDAKGFYQITLGVRENPRGSGKFFLGMQREPWTSDDDDDDDDEDANGNPIKKANTNRAPKENLPSDWVPLLEGVTGLELDYFDARINGWVPKWVDQSALPNLVRMRIQGSDNQPPYEIIARVPGGGPRPAITTQMVLPNGGITNNPSAPGAAPGIIGPNGQPGTQGNPQPIGPGGRPRIPTN